MTEDDKAKRLGEAVFEAIASLPGHVRGFQKEDPPTAEMLRQEASCHGGNYQSISNLGAPKEDAHD